VRGLVLDFTRREGGACGGPGHRKGDHSGEYVERLEISKEPQPVWSQREWPESSYCHHHSEDEQDGSDRNPLALAPARVCDHRADHDDREP
jgi:hypothetical protein